MEVVTVVWVSLETERKLEEFLEESLKWGHDCHWHQRDNLALEWSLVQVFMEGVIAWWVPGDFCCGGPAQPVKNTRCLRETENLVPKKKTSPWHWSESGFQICYNSTSHTWIEIKFSEWSKNELILLWIFIKFGLVDHYQIKMINPFKWFSIWTYGVDTPPPSTLTYQHLS